MTQAPGDGLEARKVAAIVAAVQAFLDGEEQGGRGNDGAGMSAWRRDATLTAKDNFGAGQRSWTGRD